MWCWGKCGLPVLPLPSAWCYQACSVLLLKLAADCSCMGCRSNSWGSGAGHVDAFHHPLVCMRAVIDVVVAFAAAAAAAAGPSVFFFSAQLRDIRPRQVRAQVHRIAPAEIHRGVRDVPDVPQPQHNPHQGPRVAALLRALPGKVSVAVFLVICLKASQRQQWVDTLWFAQSSCCRSCYLEPLLPCSVMFCSHPCTPFQVSTAP